MRLWSLHPKYLDPQGLVALWRETLLAQAVLMGLTKGYRNHPQLERFKKSSAPLGAMYTYLNAICAEAEYRGYCFDRTKIKNGSRETILLTVTKGQMQYEWGHLMKKLKVRNPEAYDKWHKTAVLEPHPLFQIRDGGVEEWERQ